MRNFARFDDVFGSEHMLSREHSFETDSMDSENEVLPLEMQAQRFATRASWTQDGGCACLTGVIEDNKQQSKK